MKEHLNRYGLQGLDLEDVNSFLEEFMLCNGVNYVSFSYSEYDELEDYGVKTTIEKNRYQVEEF